MGLKKEVDKDEREREWPKEWKIRENQRHNAIISFGEVSLQQVRMYVCLSGLTVCRRRDSVKTR